MTNFEDRNFTWIERAVYVIVCKDTITNIINLDEIFHLLPVLWTILYDQSKPLRWSKERQMVTYHTGAIILLSIPPNPSYRE